MTGRAELFRLLKALFTVEELRIHLSQGPEGEAILDGLPQGAVELDTFVNNAIDQIVRHQTICAEFFDRLVSARPHRTAEIRQVQEVVLGQSRSRPAPQHLPVQPYTERVAMLEVWRGFLEGPARILSLVAASGAGKSQFLRARYSDRVQAGAPVALIDLEPCRAQPSSRVALLDAMLVGLRHLLSPAREDEIRAALRAAERAEPRPSREPRETLQAPVHEVGIPTVDQLMLDPHPPQPVLPRPEGRLTGTSNRDPVQHAQEGLLSAASPDLVLLFDAVEAISVDVGRATQALDVLLNEIVPSFEARGARVVLVGQVVLHGRCQTYSATLFEEHPFPDELTDEELSTLLQIRGAVSATPARRWRFPLLGGLAARLAEQGLVELSDVLSAGAPEEEPADWRVTADAVDHVLDHVGDQWLLRALREGCVLRTLTLPSLDAVLEEPAPREANTLLSRWSNLQGDGAKRWTLHPHLRTILHEALERQDGACFRRAHERARDHFDRLASTTEGNERSAAWVEAVWHELGAVPSRWSSRLLVAFARALVRGELSTCEALLRCGEDEPIFKRVVERHRYDRDRLRQGLEAAAREDEGALADMVVYLLNKEAVVAGVPAEERATLLRNVAEQRLRTEQPDEARELLDQARALDPDHPDQLRLVLALHRKHDPPGALSAMHAFLVRTITPPSYATLETIFRCVAALDEMPWLVERLEALAGRFPDDETVGVALASALNRVGRVWLALQVLEALVTRGLLQSPEDLQFRAQLCQQLGDAERARAAWLQVAEVAGRASDDELRGDALLEAGLPTRDVMRAWETAALGEVPSVNALRKLVRLGLREGLVDGVRSVLDAAESRGDDDLDVACQEGRIRLALHLEGTVNLDPIWERLGSERGSDAALAAATEEATEGAPERAAAVYRAVASRTHEEVRRVALVELAMIAVRRAADLPEPERLWAEVAGEIAALPAASGVWREQNTLEALCALLCRLERTSEAVAALRAAGEEVDRIAALVAVGRRLRVAGMPQIRDRWWDEGAAELLSAPRDERERRRLELRLLVREQSLRPEPEQLERLGSFPIDVVDRDLRFSLALFVGIHVGRHHKLEDVCGATERYLGKAKQDLVLAMLARQICDALAVRETSGHQASALEFALELYVQSARRRHHHAAEALELAADLCFRRLWQRSRAAELADQALALQPDRCSALALAVEIQCRAGHLKRAESYLDRLNRMAWSEERRAVLLRTRALWLCAKGDVQGAIEVLDEGADPEALTGKVQALGERLVALSQGPQERQLRAAALERCAQRWPDHPAGLTAGFSIAVRRRDLVEANRVLSLLETVSAPNQLTRLRHLLMARSGQRETVLAELQDAETGELAVEPLTTLADDLFDHDAQSEAFALYEILVERARSNRPLTMVRLGDLRRELTRDFERSKAVLEQALALYRGDPGLWFSLQRTLVRLGDYEGAIRAADAEIAHSGESTMVRDISMAYILGARGESRAAVDHMLRLYGWDRFDTFLATIQERIAQDASNDRAAGFTKEVFLRLASRTDVTGSMTRLEWLVALGDLEAADDLLAQVGSDSPAVEQPRLLWYRVELLARRGEIARAVDLVLRADQPQATMEAVVQLLRSHGAHLVCADLCEAIAARRGPEEAEAWTHAGLSLLNAGATIDDRARSVRALTRALELNPDDQRAWAPLIQELLRARQDVVAAETMVRWREHGYRLRVGDTMTPHQLLVDLANGRAADAVRDFLLASGPSAIHPMLQALHGSLVRLDRSDLEVRLQEGLVERYQAPHCDRDRMLLTQVQLATGDLDAAERNLEDLSRAGLQGADRVLQVMRATLQVLRGQVEDAASTLIDNTPVEVLPNPVEHLTNLAIDRHGLQAGVRLLEAMAAQPQMDAGPLLSSAADLVERSAGVPAARAFLARAHLAHPADQPIALARLRRLSRLRAWGEAEETLALLCATPASSPQAQLENEALHAYIETARGRVRQALRRVVRAQPGRAGVETLKRLAQMVGEDGHRWGMDLLFATFEYFSEELRDDEHQPLARIRHLLERGDRDEAEHLIETLRQRPPQEGLNELLILRGVAIALREDIPAAVRALDAGRGPRDHLARLDQAISLLLPLAHGKAAAARLLEHIGRERLRSGPDALVQAAEIWRVNKGDHEAAWRLLELALDRCAGVAELRRVHLDRLVVALAAGDPERAQRVAEALDELAVTNRERDQVVAAKICAALVREQVSRAQKLVGRLSSDGRLWSLSTCARWLWKGDRLAQVVGLFDRLGVLTAPQTPAAGRRVDAFERAWAMSLGGDAPEALEVLLAGRSPEDGHEDVETLAQGLRAAGHLQAAAEIYVSSGRRMHPQWREDWLAALEMLEVGGDDEARLEMLRRAVWEVDGLDIQMAYCEALEQYARRANDDGAEALWREVACATRAAAEYFDDSSRLDIMLLATSIARKRAHDLVLASEMAEEIERLHPESGLPRLELARISEAQGDMQCARAHLKEALRREKARIGAAEDTREIERWLLLALLQLKLGRPHSAADTLDRIAARPEAQGIPRYIQRLRGVLAMVQSEGTPEVVDASPKGTIVWMEDLKHDIDALQQIGELTPEQRDVLVEWLDSGSGDRTQSEEV